MLRKTIKEDTGHGIRPDHLKGIWGKDDLSDAVKAGNIKTADANSTQSSEVTAF